MMKRKGFTLVEMLLVVVISGSLFTTIYSVMTTLPKMKLFNDARMQLIEQSNDVMNRLGILFQDYTVDYEEYFNRSHVGTGLTDKEDHYEVFSAYGNQTKVPHAGNENHYIKYFKETPSLSEAPLSYGQYKAMFRNMGEDTDGQGKLNFNSNTSLDKFMNVGDADDKDLGQGPEAISVGKIHELYLISHDGTRRLFLRRNCKTDDSCTIQMLRLRGFDAGSEHKFQANDSKTYDGEIDTWACDAGEGFICNGNNISDQLYSNYKLPNSGDDGWVDLFDNAISIENWNINIIPHKNPEYAWAENDMQINPFITISFTAKLRPSALHNILKSALSNYSFSLQTSFDTKGFYTK